MLSKRNEQLELEIVRVESLKQEITHLNDKFFCVEQIELALIEQVASNELRLKAYKNLFDLVKVYHDKNQKDLNLVLVLTMISKVGKYIGS